MDKPAADQFIVDFQEFVRSKGYTNDQIFNTNESGLYFKLLPQKLLAAHFKKTGNNQCLLYKNAFTFDRKVKKSLVF